MRPREFLVLFLLALIWGASFLFIRIAVKEISPFTLVALRLGLATLALVPLAIARPKLLAGWPRFVPGLFLVGLVNSALPYTLFGIGEQRIESGQASILNAATPLFAVVLTASLRGKVHERLTVTRVVGALVGFAGVVTLVGPDTYSGHGPLFSYLACLIAAGLYAVGGILARLTLADAPLLVTVMGVEAAGCLLMIPVAVVTGLPTQLPSAPVIISVVLLGVMGTSVALLLFYWLLQRVGVTRTFLVTYLLPCTGLFWGALILHEVVTPYALLGLVLVLLGIGIINQVFRNLFQRTKPPVAVEPALVESAPGTIAGTSEE